MNVAINQVQVNAQRVVVLQIIIAGLAAVIFGVIEGGWQALSAFFGGFISVSVSWLLRRGVLKANEVAKENPQKSMMVLYFGAVQRFVLVLALFGLGLGLFKFAPLPTVIGFGTAQVAYALVMRKTAHPAKR